MIYVYCLFGFCVFLGVLRIMWKAHARRWNRLAAEYPHRVPSTCRAERKFQSLIFTGGGIAFSSYKGIVSVGVTDSGLSLRLLAPCSLFHRLLLIPFDNLQIQPASWYLNVSSYKLVTSAVPEISMIIDGELLTWITDQAPGRIPNSWEVCGTSVQATPEPDHDVMAL